MLNKYIISMVKNISNSKSEFLNESTVFSPHPQGAMVLPCLYTGLLLHATVKAFSSSWLFLWSSFPLSYVPVLVCGPIKRTTE